MMSFTGKGKHEKEALLESQIKPGPSENESGRFSIKGRLPKLFFLVLVLGSALVFRLSFPTALKTLENGNHLMPDPSRHQTVNAANDDITGVYTLKDLLALQTNGNIDVDILLDNAAKDGTDEARFVAFADGGSVKVRFPQDSKDVPLRKYQTNVTATNGSIEGTYLTGESLDLKVNGNEGIRAQAMVNDCQNKSYLSTTAAKNASTMLEIAALNKKNCEKINGLESTHRSEHGDITVHNPVAWAGECLTHLCCWSTGVEVIIDGIRVAAGRGPYSEVLSKVREGKSSLEASSSGGYVHLIFGKGIEGEKSK